MAGTRSEFAETAALLAVLEEDDERLARLLEDMHPTELFALAENAETLADEARRMGLRKSTRSS